MKPKFTNIVDALKELRPNDKPVKVLSNKFAIVMPAYEDGGFADKTVMGLDKDVVYSYCSERDAQIHIESVADMPNIEREMIAYYADVKLQLGSVWRCKTRDNRRYKRHYRKIQRLLAP